MLRSLARRRVVSWIACFAIALNALAPSVSQAIAAYTGQTGWTQICSLAGLRWVQIAEDDLANSQEDGAPGQQQLQTQQCPFCGLHAGSVALLPPTFASIEVVTGFDAHPTLFYAAPRPLFQWASAHPRAPPLAS